MMNYFVFAFDLDQTRINPTYANVNIGKSHQIVCETFLPAIWTMERVSFKTGKYVSTSQGTVTFKRLDSNSGGVYTCKGFTITGEIFYAKSTLKVLCELFSYSYDYI